MATEDVSVQEINVDMGDESDEDIVRKISSDYTLSRIEWQDLKRKFTDYYFDFLSYKEQIADKTKSNTFLPLPYVATIGLKSRIKQAILATRPYGWVIPEPYDLDLSWKLSLLYDSELDGARYARFIDTCILDALIYGSAPFQVVHEQIIRDMPAFERDRSGRLKPKFDDLGARKFEGQISKDGIGLYNVPIQDFFLPSKCVDAETARYNAKIYRAGFEEIAKKKDFYNLDKLYELRRARKIDSGEQARLDIAQHKTTSQLPVYVYDILEYTTDRNIFHWAVGSDFLIYRGKNPYGRKPFHLAQVYHLNNEPYGLSPLGEGHLMAHTINDVIDVMMDELNLTNNKMFIVNEDMVNDYECRATQSGIIHVRGLDSGMDVQTAVRVVETRAIAPEILPLIQMFKSIHDQVANSQNVVTGTHTPGAETAFENSLLSQGALGRSEDMIENLDDSLGQKVYQDINDLHNQFLNQTKNVRMFDSNGQIVKNYDVLPIEAWGQHSFRFDWASRERSRTEERAQLTQLLQVLGTITNFNEATAPIIENLLVLSGVKDMDRIKKGLEAVIQQQKQMMMAKAGGVPPGMGGTSEFAPGGQDEMTKQIGDVLGQSLNTITPQETGGGM